MKKLILALILFTLPILSYADYSEEKVIEEIRISADGTIFVQEATIILKDGIPIARKSNTSIYDPTQEILTDDEKVNAIAEVVRTPKVIKDFKDELKKKEKEEGR